MHQNNNLVGPNSQNVTPFNFNGLSVRSIVSDNGDVMFVASDVTKILGYSNISDAVKRHCKSQNTIVIHDGKRGNPNLTVIPERDVYRLIINSKLPSAERFEEWVVAEVLPSIRKTGSYIPGQQQTQSVVLLDAQLLFVEKASSILNCSETSKIKMLANVATNNGLPSNLLPSYVDEKLTRSLSELLKIHGSNLSATKANKILLELGYLQKLTRPSTGKTTKEFWNITSTGLRYGKNEISVQNDKETQPRWYEETFPELLNEIEHQARCAA
jgi:prophage antirepressor-like protein